VSDTSFSESKTDKKKIGLEKPVLKVKLNERQRKLKAKLQKLKTETLPNQNFKYVTGFRIINFHKKSNMGYLNKIFITLLSNDSMNVFPDNVKCAFTNIVYIPEDMNDDWDVGITDIYLNNCIKYTNTQTEFVSLINAETFRDTNLSVQTNGLHCIIMERKKILNLKILNIILWTYAHQMKSQY